MRAQIFVLVKWFACMFVHIELCVYKKDTVGTNLNYNVLIDIVSLFSLYVLGSVNSKKYQMRICSTHSV